jgi:aspartyl-tRNA(Asn)/glutamyl-tRNA(Gln) amidotransferase subunit B
MNWETVIGIEIHVELNTKTKMFCRCSADYFGKAPNTHTCPICLGLPGALPFINEEAIKKCIQIGLALNCTVNDQSYFERKNYFYPDLAKGYQISQLVKPLNVNGSLTLDNGKVIRINRAHQEEDTGKLTHTGGETLVDFNRSGVPLVEIVTEPDFRSSEEVRDYAKKLQQIFKHIGVSNADMERGDMRLEANVSVRPVGQEELAPYRVELKNINSFRFMVGAIEFEVKRQIEALEKGEKLTQETRGWNETKKETYLQRSKEEAHDYRYFPEPDLPELRDLGNVLGIKGNEIELPDEKTKRFQEEYGINKQQASLLASSKDLAAYFEGVVKAGKDKNINATQIANYILNRKISTDISPDQILEEIQSKSSGIISDEEELEKICKEAIAENDAAAKAYISGKETALQALVGAVMRKTAGKADASKVAEILRKVLE